MDMTRPCYEGWPAVAAETNGLEFVTLASLTLSGNLAERTSVPKAAATDMAGAAH